MFNTSLYDEILYDEYVKVLFRVSLPKGRTWIFTRDREAGLLSDGTELGVLTAERRTDLATEERGISLLTKMKSSNI